MDEAITKKCAELRLWGKWSRPDTHAFQVDANRAGVGLNAAERALVNRLRDLPGGVVRLTEPAEVASAWEDWQTAERCWVSILDNSGGPPPASTFIRVKS